MRKVISSYSTTDGRTVLIVATGNNTGDVEEIEIKNLTKHRDCDCRVELQLYNGFCKRCEAKFYKSVREY